MEWAFTRGTSTAAEAGPRGMGLDLLKEFVRVSHGVLVIYSHDGYTRIDVNGVKHENLRSFFEGTLVQVTLRCDDTYSGFFVLAIHPWDLTHPWSMTNFTRPY